MADITTGSNSDPFAVASLDTGAQRKQIAQYAIMQAATYMQDNKYDQAIGSFKKALALDPQNATAYNYLGKIYMSQGKNADAIKSYQQLVRLQSNPYLADSSSNAPTIADAHVSLGNAYLQDKQYAASEKEFKAAARLDPTNPLPDYTLGLQYANTDRLSEAETQFLKVKKISPKDGNVYYALGMVYNKQGRHEEAAASLEKALTLKKKFPAANYELGVAYDALGRTEDAQNQLSILQNSDPVQARNLQTLLNKPRMNYMSTKRSGGFSGILGPGVPLWMLDPSQLSNPNSSKIFTIKIGFSADMDLASVTNTQNWSISRANGGKGGYYDYTKRPNLNTTPSSSTEVALPSNPEAVSYDPITREAILMFRLTQDSNIDLLNTKLTAIPNQGATLDESHIVFTFSGKDALGRDMDKSANEIDGFSIAPF